MAQDWISVANFWKYQHYKDRNPPWVKWHVDALEDELLGGLWTETRLFWALLLLVATKKENVIPRDGAWLAREVMMTRRSVNRALTQLVQAGFVVEFASREACKLASAEAREAAINGASPRVRPAETETETEPLAVSVPRDQPEANDFDLEEPREIPSFELRSIQ